MSDETLMDAKPPMAEAREEARAAYRVFAGEDGQVVLNHLRTTTIERSLGPNATDAELRDLEGQRRLFKRIENLIKTGGPKP